MVWHQLSIFEFFLRAPILAKSVHEPFASAAMWMRHKGSNESNAASAPIRCSSVGTDTFIVCLRIALLSQSNICE